MNPPAERLERIEAWGMSSASVSYLYRPTTFSGILDVLETARSYGLPVGVMGGGNSYGDAFQNAEGVLLDLSRMNRILSFDPHTGVMRCEAGLTIRDLWRHVIDDGWWPPVVSGTSHVTVGGALSANIHGKNNYHAGPIGDHVKRFDILLASGETRTCSRSENSEIFYAGIGGFGLLGVVTAVELQLVRIFSGLLEVQAFSVADWHEAFATFDANRQADYIVGWIDCLKAGRGAGRGLIHAANYRKQGDDPHPEESLNLRAQEPSDTVVGWLPRSQMYKVIRRFMSARRMALINAAKFKAGKREHEIRKMQPVAEFNFLLDSAPNWKWAYKPGGLIQYQPFVPKENARRVFDEITTLSRDRRHPPYLGVMKRHRADPFLLSHAVDGYSLALDYPIGRSRESLWDLCHAMDEIVLNAGGRFYFAKDSTLRPEAVREFLGEGTVQQFLGLKRRLDPENLFQTELSKRLFGRLRSRLSRQKAEPQDDTRLLRPFWAKSPTATTESPANDVTSI
ncbi:MAG: FAD-binding oxidoreductase [Fimbriimonadales bacterium]